MRESTSFPGDYTLCVSFDNKVEHYHIMYKDTKLTIDEEECFENLNQLIEVGAPVFLVVYSFFIAHAKESSTFASGKLIY